MDINTILHGLLNGILTAYLLIYGLRPSIPYPEYILEIFEHKWIFVILILINYYVIIWNYRTGCLLLLCLIALVFDYMIFVKNGLKKVVKIVNSENFNTTRHKEEVKGINDILVENIKQLQS